MNAIIFNYVKRVLETVRDFREGIKNNNPYQISGALINLGEMNEKIYKLNIYETADKNKIDKALKIVNKHILQCQHIMFDLIKK